RLVRIIRRWRHRIRFLADKLLQVMDSRFELRVLAGEGRMRQVIHDEVRVDPMAFDQPGALRPVDADLASRRNAAVRQPVPGAEPDLSTPGSSADHLAKAKTAKAFAEGLAVRCSPLVAEHYEVTAKCLLHVPKWLTGARLPVHPRFAHELSENPAIDIAAPIVANVDDQARAVEHRRILFDPLADVTRPHR